MWRWGYVEVGAWGDRGMWRWGHTGRGHEGAGWVGEGGGVRVRVRM